MARHPLTGEERRTTYAADRRRHRVAREAHAIAREGAVFDLVLTDIEMPDMDGYALAAALRGGGGGLFFQAGGSAAQARAWARGRDAAHAQNGGGGGNGGSGGSGRRRSRSDDACGPCCPGSMRCRRRRRCGSP